jgi:LmbE family N-acetylglucosaminyl deacetylase
MRDVDTDGLPRRLLGVWPHPDDEAYLSTGLMGRMTDAGHHVTVLTVTSGEKGTSDPADFGQPHFARQREEELRNCLAVVGVEDLILLGYVDGQCAQVPDADAVEAIARVIERVQPDTVITFGSDGHTGHPDHRAVSRWTTAAWVVRGAGDLLYAAMTESFLERHADRHEVLGLFTEFELDDPVGWPDGDIAVAIDLTESELDRKRRALAAHGSQTAGLAELLGEAEYRTWWRTENFRRPTDAELAGIVALTGTGSARARWSGPSGPKDKA